MPTLTMAKGLPASGKTSWSKQQNAKRVNKDDLRAMIDNGEWSKENEKNVLKVRNALINQFLFDGFDVIVDDTNLHPDHEKTLSDIARNHQINFIVKDFTDVSLSTCLKRDSERANSVGEKVIKSMYNSFLKPKKHVAQYTIPVVNPDLPYCLILDIDGTIAHMTNRSPYDYSQVHTDVIDTTILDIVQRYSTRDIMSSIPDTYIIVVSGREDGCMQSTEEWLNSNFVPYDEIYMRATGDQRNDCIVKEEIYNQWVRDRYNVRFILDDRNRVVEKWRELGLVCLQVAPGDF